MANKQIVTGGKPTAKTLYRFSPNVDFVNRIGHSVSGYMKGAKYSVREGNSVLHDLVQMWAERDAYEADEFGKSIKDTNGERIPCGCKLVTIGG